ncbi:MAG TPA: S1C family serine protease [Steroidobacteraceae bacterium]|jgi:S1-C subfamily serine protease|nr:S1C family serine protease [Steroidobacteraceae bacterium]
MEIHKRDEWELPETLRPQQSRFSFDLQTVYRSAVLVHTEASEDGYTAQDLGTERLGSGVVIRSAERKLVLTIGYLITEAESIWLTTLEGKVVEACPLAHDQVSGFGLIQPLGPLDAPPLERGSATSLAIGDKVIVVGHGGERHCLEAQLIARREFAGYWEYLLDEALFTAPPHPQWGGTALVGADGLLLGIGSLFVQESQANESFDANMFVPIDLLEPILEDMIALGRPRRHPRPWLGLYAAEQADHVIIAGVTRGGPSDKAGVRTDDVILEVASRRVRTLPELFRTIWTSGEAGIQVPLKLSRGEETLHIVVNSATRDDFLKKPARH